MPRIDFDPPATAEVKQAIREKQKTKTHRAMRHQPQGKRNPVPGHKAHEVAARYLGLRKVKITRK